MDNLTRKEIAKLEMLTMFYRHHSIEEYLDKYREFVIDDFNEILKILEKALEV